MAPFLEEEVSNCYLNVLYTLHLNVMSYISKCFLMCDLPKVNIKML